MATGIMKKQRNMIPPKEYSKPPANSFTQMEIQELSDKEFKIIVLTMLRELQENTRIQINNLIK